jgi:hypothetical protein
MAGKKLFIKLPKAPSTKSSCADESDESFSIKPMASYITPERKKEKTAEGRRFYGIKMPPCRETRFVSWYRLNSGKKQH